MSLINIVLVFPLLTLHKFMPTELVKMITNQHLKRR